MKVTHTTDLWVVEIVSTNGQTEVRVVFDCEQELKLCLLRCEHAGLCCWWWEL